MGKEQFQIPEQELRKNAIEQGITHLVIGVAVLKDGRLLIVRRVPNDFMGGNFELPSGGVEDGESILSTIQRETLEETGLQVVAVLSMHKGFDYKTEKKNVRQFNFLVETSGYDVSLEPLEHDDFAWVSEEELDNYLMTPEMKENIRRIFENIK